MSATPVIKVMPLGDSITAGTDQHASYRCLLYQSLTAAGYNVDFVGSVHGQWGVKSAQKTAPPAYCNMVDLDHEGHSGWAIYHILEGVPSSWDGNLQAWAAANPPDVALVHLGTNNFGYGPPEYPAPDVDAAIDQLGQVIDTLRAANPQVKILLAQITPSKASNDTLTMIPQYNARIPALAAGKANALSPIVVVDQYTGYDVNVDTYDGTHPSPSGEAKMAARWKSGFDQIMKPRFRTFFPQVIR
jgi:acyl-CoA thioesterase-1